MKYLVLFFIFSLCSLHSFAQKHDYNWIFGSYVWQSEVNRNGNILNFAGEQVEIDIYEKEFYMYFTSVTYSDEEGNLLFSSNGCRIYDAGANLIENGEGLNPGETAEDFCFAGDLSAYISDNQTMLALPGHEDSNICHLFHKRLEVENGDAFDYLLYTKIDIGSKTERPKVLKKNILVDTLTSDGLLTAVKKENLNGWWIVTPKRFTDEKIIVELANDEIKNIKYQKIGEVSTADNHGSSYSSFSPDGSKYAIFGESDGLQLFDFDRETGELYNYQYIDPPRDFQGGWAGLAFSASGRFLYTSHYKKIYQYDLWRADVEESRLSFDWIENYDDVFGDETPFFRMERGPDCRIYITAYNSTNTIHVIHHPDRKGEACMLQQNINTPAHNIATLPHFPNYRLDTDEVCDSSKIFPPELMTALANTLSEEEPSDSGISIYPNPSKGKLDIEFALFRKGKTELVVNDLQGRLVFHKSFLDAESAISINLNHLVDGIYFYKFINNDGLLKEGKLLIVK